ncbi:hypothetical protein HY546_03640, partial [archaeon]|nr:hypothetical protein [archaeon]
APHTQSLAGPVSIPSSAAKPHMPVVGQQLRNSSAAIYDILCILPLFTYIRLGHILKHVRQWSVNRLLAGYSILSLFFCHGGLG